MEAVGSPEALFLILLIQEAGIYVPLPGNWLMAFAGVRAAEGAMSARLALLAGVAATLLGATALYWLARRGGRPLVDRHGHRFGLTQSRLARVELALVRWGVLAVFVGRLVPGVRCGSSFAAGLLGVRFAPFLAATAASAFVWWGFWLWVGWSLGPTLLQRFDATSGQFLAVVALVSLAGTALVLTRALVRYVGWSGVRRSAASLLSLSRIVASTRSR